MSTFERRGGIMPTFTTTKNGYTPMEVDAYINSLEQEIKVYKEKETAINKAIISAQMASDKMIKQANEESASVIKKANDEAAEIIKKANTESADIVKKANDEKDKIMAEAQKFSAALAENANKEIQDIKSNISQQRTIINSFNADYKALVEKYLKSYDASVSLKVVKDLDSIEALINKWDKEGVPTAGSSANKTAEAAAAAAPQPKPAVSSPAPAPTPAPSPVSSGPAFGTGMKKPDEAPKIEPAPSAVPPSPLASSSVPKADDSSAQDAPKQYIKTGLGGQGMGGIPANPSYGLGGERTLRNSINHSEAPKPAEPAPEPISAANMTVPKFGEMTASSAPDGGAPKPGIYKVTSDNTLYNDNRPMGSEPAPANTAPAGPATNTDSAPAPKADPAVNNTPKPGIYKVTSDNTLYNENNKPNPPAGGIGSDASGVVKPGIYKVPKNDTNK